MSTSGESINNIDYNVICQFFLSLNRQGPGSKESTLRALSLIENLSEIKNIADLGCGTGSPTLLLAEMTSAQITALDLFPAFLSRLNDNAKQMGFGDRIKTMQRSMLELPFEDESLDMIWSEGAIYNIGFKKGFVEWKRFLKPGGYIAVTDATWFRRDPAPEIFEFWNNSYPEIDYCDVKCGQILDAGYEVIGIFRLPQSCWSVEYYSHVPAALESFKSKYSGVETATELIGWMEEEMRLYAKYGETYGYTFYIARKL